MYPPPYGPPPPPPRPPFWQTRLGALAFLALLALALFVAGSLAHAGVFD
jgi:hypothetical protein